MKKFFVENRTNAAMALLVFAFMAALLSVAILGFQDRDEEEYEAILRTYASDGILIYGADDSAPPLRFVDKDGVYTLSKKFRPGSSELGRFLVDKTGTYVL